MSPIETHKNNILNLVMNRGSLLVFLYTGSQMYGCIAKKNKQSVELSEIVQSGNIDTNLAIADIKEKLNAIEKQLPHKAILGSIEIVNGMVDIPVSPEKPRSYSQMQELLHWEIDPFLSELNDITTIGSLLQGRGHISAEQRDQIALEMAILNEQGERTRFGEVALQLKLIDRESLDESLSLQEHLVSHDEQIICGWSGSSIKNDEGETNQYWNATGISEHRRNHWTQSFKTNELQLVNLLPLYGSSLRSIIQAHQLGAKEALLVEVFQEQIFSYRVKQGKIVSIRIERRLEQKLSESIFVSLCYDQLRPSIETIDIVCDESIHQDVISQVEVQLQRKVRITNSKWFSAQDDKGVSSNVSQWIPWLQGLADNGLDKKLKIAQLPKIQPVDPLPPIWKQENTWRYGIPIMMFLGLIAFDISQRVYLNYLDDKLDSLNLEFNKAGKVNNQFTQISNISNSIKHTYEFKEKQLKEIKIDYERLNDRLYARIKGLPNLLRSIASSVNSNIVLNSIHEYQKKTGVRITGSSLNNQDAQRFVARLNKSVKEHDFIVSDVQIEQTSKRLGNDAFSFNLWLLKKKDKPSTVKNDVVKN